MVGNSLENVMEVIHWQKRRNGWLSLERLSWSPYFRWTLLQKEKSELLAGSIPDWKYAITMFIVNFEKFGKER